MGNTKEKSTGIITSIAISLLYFTVASNSNINVALQSIATAFPGIGLFGAQLLSSVSSIIIIPASIFARIVVEKRFKYRTLVAIGTILVTIGGTIPYFLNSYPLILASRVVFGIGIGLYVPLLNTLVIKLFDGRKQANMLSAAGFIISGGAIIMTLMAGAFAAIDWHMTFLTYLWGILPFIFVWFIKEPTPTQGLSENGPKEKSKLSGGVYWMCFVFIIVVLCMSMLPAQLSSIITLKEMGASSLSGISFRYCNFFLHHRWFGVWWSVWCAV
jgi:MFS family permease